MSESDFGRKTTGGRRGKRHTTTGTTDGHAEHGHGETHTKRKQTHRDKQTRNNERKGEMKGKTLAALIGMLFGTFLFFGQTGFAATDTFNTSDVSYNTFTVVAYNGTGNFTNITRDNFTSTTFTRGDTTGTNFGGVKETGTAEFITTKSGTVGRETFEFVTSKFSTTTDTNNFARTPFAFGGNVRGFTESARGFFEEARF